MRFIIICVRKIISTTNLNIKWKNCKRHAKIDIINAKLNLMMINERNLPITVRRSVKSTTIEKQKFSGARCIFNGRFSAKDNTGEYFPRFSDFPNIFLLLDERCNLRFVREVQAFGEIGMFRYIEARAVSYNTPQYFSEALYTRSNKQYRSLQSGLKFRNGEETPV